MAIQREEIPCVYVRMTLKINYKLIENTEVYALFTQCRKVFAEKLM
jgi:hypothetical protein